MRNILIPVIVVALGVGGYYGFQAYQQKETVDIWGYIPENAAVVYESEEGLPSFMEVIDSITFFSNISTLNQAESSSNSLAFLSYFKEIHSLSSIHVSGKKTIDILFVFDLSNSDKLNVFENKIQELVKTKKYTNTIRTYREIEINEISGMEVALSYVIYDNTLIVSKASFLVEDAIRTLLDKDLKTLKETNDELFILSKLKNDNGNLYVNGTKITDLVNVFLKNDFNKYLLKSIFYDLNIDKNRLLLNGFGHSSNDTELNQFISQNPSEINVFEYIPNGILYLYHIGLSDSRDWLKEIDAEEDSLDLDRLNKWVGNEIAVYETDRSVGSANEKVLFVKTRDVNEALNHINILAETHIDEKVDSMYVETYADYEIKELKVKEFPRQAFGDVYCGFDQSYYLVIDGYLVLSNSVNAIKMLLNSVEEEDVWGRSIEQDKFLQSTLKEANVSLFVNIPKMWDGLLMQMDDKWRELFMKMELQNTVSNGAIQFSNVGDKYYSSIVLEFTNNMTKKGSFDVELETYFESNTVTKPFIVKNHNDHSYEVLIQDSLTQLYLVDGKGDILWKDSIGEIITSSIHQIDYYKNRKLQYFFSTSNKVHLIDRKGNYVEDFPKQLDSEIHQLSVVDYDNSKNYRFIIEDGEGSIYTYDKNLKNLEGWNPRKIDGKLSEAVRHMRVRGKDYMLAMQKSGQINVMNRRGEFIEGFPLKLDIEISGNSYLSIGSDIKSTSISVVSNEGKLVTFNLEGDIVDRKELYKPTKEAQFKITVGNSNKSFIIYRYDKHRLAVLDANGNQIFEKDYLDANISNVQYYDLGTGNEVYAVNDAYQNYTYIYNHRGEMVNFTPLNSGFGIGLLDYSSLLNKRMVYVSYKSSLSVYSY